ncbi:MAG TPA: 3-phosphoserine/phosphohydroxythreonine transaminase [Bacteroidia bacterium]|nr:3-phosphoserine/phosphohydroxythreonine transaminase [Bacteroidia bacterium]
MKHNFGAGPGILPAEVFTQASQAILNFNQSGLSILEISHRSKDFEAVMDRTRALVKELLQLSNDYEILFLGGGASTQFAMVPLNLLRENGKAAYLKTGVWASKAMKEARLLGQTDVVASSEDRNYNYIPHQYSIPPDADYFHITSNNTIYGTQIHQFPECNIPLVCDMSSDIFSRQFDANRFALIYAGAQKNMGPAGATMVIVNKNMLGKSERKLSTMFDYRTHADNGSMFNTPPVYAIYVIMLTLEWVKKMGGVAAMEKRNKEKADLFYSALDANPVFEGTAHKNDRSAMNACFLLKNKEMDNEFLALTKEKGIVGIKGHRSVGGFRASMYNALDIESVKILTETMNEFALKTA